MIHVIDPYSELPETQEGITYGDVEERLPWTALELPNNPNVSLHVRVLYAQIRGADDKTRHRFFVQYLPMGEGSYIPNKSDIEQAFERAQLLLQQNLVAWSREEDALGEVVKPTKDAITAYIASLKG